MGSITGFTLGKGGYNTFVRAITNEEKKLLSSVFHEVDDGNKGYLTREDFKVAVAEVFGYKPSKYEADQIFESYGDSFGHCVGLSLGKYLEMMTQKLSKTDLDEQVRHTFMAFDSSCRGFLSVEDLRKAMSQVAPHIPAHIVDSTFKELDRDGDGRISYKDFDFIMKYDVISHI